MGIDKIIYGYKMVKGGLGGGGFFFFFSHLPRFRQSGGKKKSFLCLSKVFQCFHSLKKKWTPRKYGYIQKKSSKIKKKKKIETPPLIAAKLFMIFTFHSRPPAPSPERQSVFFFFFPFLFFFFSFSFLFSDWRGELFSLHPPGSPNLQPSQPCSRILGGGEQEGNFLFSERKKQKRKRKKNLH